MVTSVLMVCLAAAAQDTMSVTLEAAAEVGARRSPAVAAAMAARAAPKGERAEAIWPFPTPPTIEFGRTRRAGLASTTFDRSWAVRQEIDVSGQSFARATAAGKRASAAQHRVDDAERIAALEARLAYLDLVVADQRASMLDTAAQFGERMADVARRQLAGGAINALEANAALLDAARQRSTADRAVAARIAAAAELARVTGQAASSAFRPAGLPALPTTEMPDADVLTQLAVARRPDRMAAVWEARGAAGDVTASRLAQLPLLEVGAHWGSEAGTDDLRGFSLGVRVPLFRRGQAQRGLSVAARGARDAELDLVDRRIRAELIESSARFARAREAERRFVRDVLRAADENVALSERAFEEGKIGIPDVILLRSVAIGARLEHTEVVREAYGAWFRLAAALAVAPHELDTLLEGAR